MTTYYLGQTASGQPVTRKSNRADYTHAAVPQGWLASSGRLPSFGTSAEGAARNFATGHGRSGLPEVVAIAIVDAKAFRAATVKAA